MNRQSLTIVALVTCLLVIAIQWATAPEGVAQIGGDSRTSFDVVEASAFLLKDENGKIVGGLTTGPGKGKYWPKNTPSLFIKLLIRVTSELTLLSVLPEPASPSSTKPDQKSGSRLMIGGLK